MTRVLWYSVGSRIAVDPDDEDWLGQEPLLGVRGNLSPCHRCGGQLLIERDLFEVEWVCFQCGSRSDAQPTSASTPR